MRTDFGDVHKLPAMFGRREMIIISDPDEIEKVFRSEGKLPFRAGVEVLNYYTKTLRPDIYGEYGSLVTE